MLYTSSLLFPFVHNPRHRRHEERALIPIVRQPTASMDLETRFLLTGSEGWICGHLESLLNAQGKTVHATNYRMEDSAKMNEIFDEFQPTHVINCAGKTGRPNVDWCEDHRVETVRSNVIGTLMLAELCHERGVHLTNMATGCR